LAAPLPDPEMPIRRRQTKRMHNGRKSSIECLLAFLPIPAIDGRHGRRGDDYRHAPLPDQLDAPNAAL
jgi:hypothetical protein